MLFVTCFRLCQRQKIFSVYLLFIMYQIKYFSFYKTYDIIIYQSVPFKTDCSNYKNAVK